MKQLWLHFVESYLRIGFAFYYKKIEAHYEEKLPKNKAVLFLSNHQNALLDPLLITIKTKRKNHFLTRANVFSKPFVAKILKSLQMLPVYRMRDGIKTILKNKEIFSFCVNLLHRKKSIILFPEGSHSLVRSVRPLSKGFTRIVDETFQEKPETELHIVPIGLNFQNPKDYGDSMSIYFGKSINASAFWKEGQLDIVGLKKAVSEAIEKLTTHIERGDLYSENLAKLNDLQVDFTKPKLVNECLKNNFKYTGSKIKGPNTIYKILKFLVTILHLIPFLIWKKIMIPKIKEPEFIGTFRLVAVVFVAPVFLVLEVFLLTYFFGNLIALLFLGLSVLLPLILLRLK